MKLNIKTTLILTALLMTACANPEKPKNAGAPAPVAPAADVKSPSVTIGKKDTPADPALSEDADAFDGAKKEYTLNIIGDLTKELDKTSDPKVTTLAAMQNGAVVDAAKLSADKLSNLTCLFKRVKDTKADLSAGKSYAVTPGKVDSIKESQSGIALVAEKALTLSCVIDGAGIQLSPKVINETMRGLIAISSKLKAHAPTPVSPVIKAEAKLSELKTFKLNVVSDLPLNSEKIMISKDGLINCTVKLNTEDSAMASKGQTVTMSNSSSGDPYHFGGKANLSSKPEDLIAELDLSCNAMEDGPSMSDITLEQLNELVLKGVLQISAADSVVAAK